MCKKNTDTFKQLNLKRSLQVHVGTTKTQITDSNIT